jgi:hypothetical protein
LGVFVAVGVVTAVVVVEVDVAETGATTFGVVLVDAGVVGKGLAEVDVWLGLIVDRDVGGRGGGIPVVDERTGSAVAAARRAIDEGVVAGEFELVVLFIVVVGAVVGLW